MTKIILIADDEPQLRLLVRTTLEDDYEIHEAEDGEEALELAAKLNPDLFVLDNMMPKLDGVAVCKQLRADPQFSTRPIIMLTAKSQQHDITTGKAAGVDYYLTKPFSPLELMDLVEELLS